MNAKIAHYVSHILNPGEWLRERRTFAGKGSPVQFADSQSQGESRVWTNEKTWRGLIDGSLCPTCLEGPKLAR